MTQSGEDPNSLPPQPPVRHRLRLFRLLLIFIVSVSIGAALSFWMNAQKESQTGISVQTPVLDTASPSRLQALEDQMHRVDDQLNALSARVEKLEQAPAATREPASAVNTSGDVDRLKKEIQSLTESLNALYSQVRQSTQTADETRNAALATVLAFTQLRAIARDGQGFSHELQMMRQVAGNDGITMEALAKLDPIAANGAPTLTALREEFDALAAPAHAAERKAAAQTWQERIFAELLGLVSIRPLHPKPGEAGSYGVIEDDLEQHRLDAALELAKALPEAAQAVLKDWIAKAEARQTVDTAMNTIAAHLVSRMQPVETPPPSPGITVP
jgi:hypothetical protein